MLPVGFCFEGLNVESGLNDGICVPIVLFFIALAVSGESISNRLFLGWFGSRGLASIVFAIIVINAEVPEAEILSLVVIYTVILSLIAHGISANPLARWIDKKESNS